MAVHSVMNTSVLSIGEISKKSQVNNVMAKVVIVCALKVITDN